MYTYLRITLVDRSGTKHCHCPASRRRAREITRRYDEKLRPHGLQSTQFSVLAALSQTGPTPLGELSVSFLDGEDRTDIEGTYVEVVENERIVHTWNYPGESESRLTFEFRDDDGGCELVLTHERIGPYREYSAEENADLYDEGWSGALDKLEIIL